MFLQQPWFNAYSRPAHHGRVSTFQKPLDNPLILNCLYYNTSISFLPGKIFRRQQSRTSEWRRAAQRPGYSCFWLLSSGSSHSRFGCGSAALRGSQSWLPPTSAGAPQPARFLPPETFPEGIVPHSCRRHFSARSVYEDPAGRHGIARGARTGARAHSVNFHLARCPRNRQSARQGTSKNCSGHVSRPSRHPISCKLDPSKNHGHKIWRKIF